MAAQEIFRVVGRIALDGKESVERGLDDIGGKADGTQSRLGKLGGMLGGLGKVAAVGVGAAGAAVAGFATKGTLDFIGFQGQMNEVFTLMPGLSEKAMKDMSKDVKGFSKEFGTLPEEVVPALYQSISAGVPPDNVFNFLETAQKAATGGVTDLSTAVDGISSVVNAYGSDVMDATQASDLMFTAVKLGKTDFGQLSKSLFNVIPTASAIGVEFGDVTAALAAMTAQGTPTTVATTQIRQALVELSQDGGKASDTFKEVAGKSFKEFIASGGNVQEALQLMEKHAGDTGVGVNDLFGSVEAGSAVLSLTGKGTEAFGNALAEMQDSAGATDTAYQQMDKGIGRTIDKLRANFKVVLLDIGERFAPTLEKLGAAAIEFLPKLVDWFTRIADTLEGPFNSGVAIVEDLIRYFREAATEGNGLSTFFDNLMGFINPVIAGLMELIAWIRSDGLPTFLQFISWFREDAIPAIQEFADKVIPIVQDVIRFLVDTALPKIRGVIDNIVATFRELEPEIRPTMEAIRHIVEVVFGAISTFLEQHGDTIMAVLSRVWTSIERTISNATKVIKGIILLIMKLIQGDWAGAWGAIKDIAKALWDQIQNVVGLALDGLRIIMDLAWKGIQIAAAAAWRALRDAVTAFVQNLRDNAVRDITDLRNWLASLWDGIKQKASDIWNGIQQIVTGFVRGLRDNAVRDITNMRNLLSAIWDGIRSKVVGVWTGIRAELSRIVNGIRRVLETTIDNAKYNLGRKWDDIKSKAEDVWNGIKQAFDNGKTAMQDALAAPFNWFRDTIGSIMDNAARGILAPLNAALRGFQEFVSGMRNAINWVGDKLGLGTLISGYWTAPYVSLPAYARGVHNAPGGWSIVGEGTDGAEFVNLPGGSDVFPHHQTAAMLARAARIQEQHAKKAMGDNFAYGSIAGNIINNVKSVAGGIWDTVKSWAAKGAGWVIENAFERFGISLDLPGVLAEATGSIVSKIKDQIVQVIREMLEGLKSKVPQFDGTWRNPVPGSFFTQGSYGSYSHRNIPAVDLAAMRGSNIINPAGGVVAQNAWNLSGATGPTLVMDHGEGWRTLYGHVKMVVGRIGEMFRQGEKIAEVGSPEIDGGAGMGSHVHYEMFKNGVRVPPEDYINFGDGALLTGETYPIRAGEDGKEAFVPLDRLEELMNIVINFHGPVTIHARDQAEAERSVRDIGYSVRSDMKRRGLV